MKVRLRSAPMFVVYIDFIGNNTFNDDDVPTVNLFLVPMFANGNNQSALSECCQMKKSEPSSVAMTHARMAMFDFEI